MSSIDPRFSADDNVFDPNLVDGVDQSTVDSYDDIYPAIQWVNGDQKHKRAKGGGMYAWGGWFMADRSNIPDKEELLAQGWVEDTLTHEDGEETAGYYKRDLTLIPITIRERWQVRVEGQDQPMLFGFDRRDKSAKWDVQARAKQYGSPSGRLQVLCLLKGMEDFGPFVLTLGGHVAMGFHNERGGDSALGNYYKSIILAANAQSDKAARARGGKTGKKWPSRAFYVHVGPARDAEGIAVFTEVGQTGRSSYVVLPTALGLPGKGEEVDLNKWYVGHSMFATVGEIYEEAETGWARAWDTLSPTVAPGSATPVKATVARVSEAEIEATGL